MDLEIDPAKLLYAVGVLFGVAAVVYFARDLVFELSITVRALLLLLAFVVLLAAALVVARKTFVFVFAVLSATAYLAFIAYTLSRFDVGANGTFLALLVSAGLFLGLGYLVREREVKPSSTTARYIAVAVVVIAAALVGADAAASEVTYEVSIEDEATVDDRGGVVLGTGTVENRFVFREPIDPPQVLACIYIPAVEEYDMRPQPVRYSVGGDSVPDSIGGADTMSVTLSARLNEEETATLDGPIPVERAESCPDPADEPRIVVVMGEEMPRPPRI